MANKKDDIPAYEKVSEGAGKKLNDRLTTSKGLKAKTTLLSFKKGFQSVLTEDSRGYGEINYVFPTLIPEIDAYLPANSEMTENGFPAGKIHMLYGVQDSLKSALLSRIEINTLNRGGVVYHLELDGHWNKKDFLNGTLGVIKDQSPEGLSRYRYERVSTFNEIYMLIAEILAVHKEELYQYAKSNNVAPTDVYFPVDLYPIMISVDSLGTSVSETSLEKELDEGVGSTKTAEENTDIHRILKTGNALREMLGIPIFFVNQERANIQTFGGFGPKSKPYLWDSMKWAIHTALEMRAYKPGKKVFKGKSYKPIWELNIKQKKAKNGLQSSENKLPPILFHTNYGFDYIRGIFMVLEDFGFASGASGGGDLKILEENAQGDPIPEPLKKWVGRSSYKKFLETIKDPLVKRDFIESYQKAQPYLTLQWVDDGRDLDADDILFGKEITEKKNSSKEEVEKTPPPKKKKSVGKSLSEVEDKEEVEEEFEDFDSEDLDLDEEVDDILNE